MRILVTGAAGFIGSSLCNQLVRSGHQITAIDNFSNYYDVRLKKARIECLLLPLNLDVIDLDICDQSKIEKLISQSEPEVVINLAAQAGVRLGLTETNKYVSSNLVGFSNILVSTVRNKVPMFLYASSSSIYGDTANSPYSENETNLRPTSFYGGTKLANELLAPTLVRNSATAARALRFFTVYGPWGRPDMAYFRMIANTISGTEFNFYGDGSIERDFTYIEDATSSIIALMQELKSRSPGFSDVVNLGGGKPLSMNYLLQTIGSITNKKVIFNQLKTNENDVKKTMADFTYLQSLIGSKPSTTLEEGIKQTFNWAKSPEISLHLDDWVKSVI